MGNSQSSSRTRAMWTVRARGRAAWASRTSVAGWPRPLAARQACGRTPSRGISGSSFIFRAPPMTDVSPRRLLVAIVDDEDLARSVVREYLANMPDVDIVAECANGFEAVKTVADLKPDLLLLDVQMPKLNGFEVLELVGRDVAVIFVTAYDQYALRAFEVHAVDYLLKPFSAERLAEALVRARERLRRGERLPSAEIAKAARPADSHA